MLIGWQPLFFCEIILKKIIFLKILFVSYSYCYQKMNFHKNRKFRNSNNMEFLISI